MRRTVEVPAMVDFADILKSCKIEPDYDMRAPWEEGDGYEHEAEKRSSFCEHRENVSNLEVEKMQGYVWRDGWRWLGKHRLQRYVARCGGG